MPSNPTPAPEDQGPPDYRCMVETIADTLFPSPPAGDGEGDGDGAGDEAGAGDGNPDAGTDTDSPDPARRVGDRRPPLEHRFVKGRSGNPQGRPRSASRAPSAARPPAPPLGAPPLTALEKAVSRRVEIELNGRRRRLGLTQAVIARLIEKGLEGGDLVALRELLRVCTDAETAREARAAEAEARRGVSTFRWTGRTFGPEDVETDQLVRTFGEMLDAEAAAARDEAE